MKPKEGKAVPEFQSLEEEREYWEDRSALVPGRKGRLNKPQPGQRRSSFLAVRLTGEELTRLRDAAKKRGLGPSTFARMILLSALGDPVWDTLDAQDRVGDESGRERLPDLSGRLAAGDPQNPPLVFLSFRKESAEMVLAKLLAESGARVFTVKDEEYGKLKDIVAAR